MNNPLNWSRGKNFEVLFGTGVQYTEDADEESVVGILQPYGWGRFGQLNLVTALEWDSRGLQRRTQTTTQGDAAPEGEARKRYTGVRLVAGGGYFPPVWDVEDAFGAVEGNLSAYLGLGRTERVVLAGRVGGRQTFGTYPWYAAAYIGGSGSNRGFRKQRFAGDASFYANSELRLRVVDHMPVIPGRLWAVGLFDVGRVWLEDEDSDEWHPSYGGGLAFEVAGSPVVFWTGVARAREQDDLRFYFLGGFGF